ncbi:MAG: hypothetical protein ACP5R2_15640, partial [Anaerolineae bacterium]
MSYNDWTLRDAAAVLLRYLPSVRLQRGVVTVLRPVNGEQDKAQEVAGYIAPGLGVGVHRVSALTGRQKDREYSVIHLRSGLKVFGSPTLRHARQALGVLQALGCPWLSSAGDLYDWFGEMARRIGLPSGRYLAYCITND